MTSEEDVDETMELQNEADEILHFAVLHFFAMEKDINGFNGLLAMEMELLRQASRMHLIMKKFGSTTTKQQFMDLASATYDDLEKYQPKKPHIELVK